MALFLLSVAVAGGLLAYGVAVGILIHAWLAGHFKINAEQEKQLAYKVAYAEAQARIADDFKKREDMRQRRDEDELPRTGQEDIDTYEQSLKNLNYSPEQIEAALKARHRM